MILEHDPLLGSENKEQDNNLGELMKLREKYKGDLMLQDLEPNNPIKLYILEECRDFLKVMKEKGGSENLVKRKMHPQRPKPFYKREAGHIGGDDFARYVMTHSAARKVIEALAGLGVGIGTFSVSQLSRMHPDTLRLVIETFGRQMKGIIGLQ